MRVVASSRNHSLRRRDARGSAASEEAKAAPPKVFEGRSFMRQISRVLEEQPASLSAEQQMVNTYGAIGDQAPP